jgi:hypothetical protein
VALKDTKIISLNVYRVEKARKGRITLSVRKGKSVRRAFLVSSIFLYWSSTCPRLVLSGPVRGGGSARFDLEPDDDPRSF